MLIFYFFFLVATSSLSVSLQGRALRRAGAHVVKHGMFSGGIEKLGNRDARSDSLHRRQASNPTSCDSDSSINIKAPKTNIFAGLTDDEAAAVTKFLHDQKSLNLTAAVNATRQAPRRILSGARLTDNCVAGTTRSCRSNYYNRTNLMHLPIWGQARPHQIVTLEWLFDLVLL